MNNKLLKIFSVLFFASSELLFSQTGPALEMAAGDGNTTANGPVLTTTVRLRKNTDNITAAPGATFVTYTPPITATFTLTNFEYPNFYTAAQYASRQTMSLGFPAAPILTTHSAFGTPAATSFTSAGSANGAGISTTTGNLAVRIANFTAPLRANAKPTTGRNRIADLEISFDRPVNNPIINIGGMGGQNGTLGFTTEFDFNVTSSTPVPTYTKPSGTATFVLTGNQVTDNRPAYAAAGTAGAVKINALQVTKVMMTCYLRGDGGNAATTGWAPSNTDNTAGDSFTVSLSAIESDLEITKTVTPASLIVGNNVVFSLTAKNNGVTNNSNVLVNDVLPSGYAYNTHTASVGTTYIPGTGVWNIGPFNDGASATLSITAAIKATGNYVNTAVISTTSGIGDPVSSNNTSSATANPICYNNPNTGTVGADTKHGITLLKRAGATAQPDNWPMERKSAFTALESNTKGFVITRMTTAEINALTGQSGMMVYDTNLKCLKLFDGAAWSCFNTPTCP